MEKIDSNPTDTEEVADTEDLEIDMETAMGIEDMETMRIDMAEADMEIGSVIDSKEKIGME